MLSIRAATPADVPLILEFIRDLAEYEREPQAVVARPEDLLRDGFGPEPKFRCVLAGWDDEPAAFAFYFFNYSTWQGQPGLYLEDLFVRPRFRGLGIGKALLVYLAKVAVRENCGRFQWQVLDWNEPAIKFYESLGARKLTQWLTMRMEGEALERLAEQASVLAAKADSSLRSE
jgi:GNAT superfamily N-acetyltransferase